MRFTFVPKGTFIMYMTIAMFLFLLGAYKLFLLSALLIAGWSFILRKKVVYENDDQFTTRGSLFAPISGVVTDVQTTENKNIITIKTSLKDNFGLYLPSTTEVKNLNYEKDSCILWLDKTTTLDETKGVYLELYDKNRQDIALHFFKYYLGRLPELVILPGDRGQRHANIGYFLFGGLTKVYLPKTFSVEVSVGAKVISTETIIARYNDKE